MMDHIAARGDSLPSRNYTRNMPVVHPTAIVHPDAQIHDSCEIGPYCCVEAKVRLGSGTKLLSHVIVRDRTTLGADNVIHPFAVIGGIPQDLKYQGEQSELVIGDRNTVRESVTINIGTTGGGGVTRIGNDNLLMAYVHIGHDTTIGNGTIIANSCQLAGHVVIEDYASLGGLTGVGQYLRVGTHSYVGGCSGVDRDMPPYTLGRGPTGNFEILGMNIIGLKRRGFSKEDIAALQEVSRLFFQDKTVDRETALSQIESSVGSVGAVRTFVDFVRASKRGVFR